MSASNTTVHLGIDLGAGSGRAILGRLKAGRLSLQELHRFENRPVERPDGVFWDFDALWHGVLEGLRRAGEATRAAGERLASVGVDTWGVDFALLSDNGEMLAPPRCYRDPRNVAAFDAVRAQIGDDELFRLTGNQLMPLNTLFQLAAERDASPDRLAAARRLLFMPDLMHWMLAGVATNELTIASTSQMLAADAPRWATELLERLGLPIRILGPLTPPMTVLGPLRRAVAEQAGLDDGVLVIAGAGHDTACAVAAAPAPADRSWAFLSSGTWSLLGAEIDRPCLTEAARAAPFTNERGPDGTIRFLKNMTGLWLVQECRRVWESRGERADHAALIDAARAAPPFRTLIDPDAPEFATPGDMPARIAEFARRTRQPAPETIGQTVRTCLESLALSYRRTLGQLENALGRRFDVIHAFGGGARNDLLNELSADAMGRQVVVGPDEASAIGNILLQARALGRLRDGHDLREVVRSSTALRTIDPARAADWAAPADRFTSLAH